MNPQKVSVRSIIESKNGFSRVVLASQNFNDIVQSLNARWNKFKKGAIQPILKYTTTGTKDGAGVRVFNFNGVLVYDHPVDTGEVNAGNDGKEYPVYKQVFFMKTEDAENCLTTLEEERANQVKVPFNVNDFNLGNTVVA